MTSRVSHSAVGASINQAGEQANPLLVISTSAVICKLSVLLAPAINRHRRQVFHEAVKDGF